MPTSRSVVSMLLRELGDFLDTLKAGPTGGLRPPSGPATTRRSPGNRPHPHRKAIPMTFKLIESPQERWRSVNAPHLVALVRAGVRFERGVLVGREQATSA